MTSNNKECDITWEKYKSKNLPAATVTGTSILVLYEQCGSICKTCVQQIIWLKPWRYKNRATKWPLVQLSYQQQYICLLWLWVRTPGPWRGIHHNSFGVQIRKNMKSRCGIPCHSYRWEAPELTKLCIFREWEFAWEGYLIQKAQKWTENLFHFRYQSS